ncbi:hypothetical protein FAIPA1_110053 [Frankia sp. AiPs1]
MLADEPVDRLLPPGAGGAARDGGRLAVRFLPAAAPRGVRRGRRLRRVLLHVHGGRRSGAAPRTVVLAVGVRAVRGGGAPRRALDETVVPADGARPPSQHVPLPVPAVPGTGEGSAAAPARRGAGCPAPAGPGLRQGQRGGPGDALRPPAPGPRHRRRGLIAVPRTPVRTGPRLHRGTMRTVWASSHFAPRVGGILAERVVLVPTAALERGQVPA